MNGEDKLKTPCTAICECRHPTFIKRLLHGVSSDTRAVPAKRIENLSILSYCFPIDCLFLFDFFASSRIFIDYKDKTISKSVG